MDSPATSSVPSVIPGICRVPSEMSASLLVARLRKWTVLLARITDISSFESKKCFVGEGDRLVVASGKSIVGGSALRRPGVRALRGEDNDAKYLSAMVVRRTSLCFRPCPFSDPNPYGDLEGVDILRESILNF